MKIELARFALTEVFRPIISRMPRGAWCLYKVILGAVGISNRGDPIFRRHLRHRFSVFYDRFIGAYIAVDLADWACRSHYFQGRYYEVAVPLLVDTWLSSGGVFMDIGANRGIHSLYAAKRLARNGHVYAFEPNPETARVMQAHLVINHIENCSVYNIGLSNTDSSLTLNVLDENHSGTCSFISTSTAQRTFNVPVRRLDNVLEQVDESKHVLVKIDTEGYEYQVIQGMGNLLSHPNLVMICEITDRWLQAAGASAESIFSVMHDHGYYAYLPSWDYRRTFNMSNKRLKLTPIDGPLGKETAQYDVVFARRNIVLGD